MFPNYNRRPGGYPSMTDDRVNPDVFKELLAEKRSQQRILIVAAIGITVFLIINLAVLISRVVLIDSTSGLLMSSFQRIFQDPATTPNIPTLADFRSFYTRSFIAPGVIVALFSVFSLFSILRSWRASEEYGSYHLLSIWTTRWLIITIALQLILYLPFNNTVGSINYATSTQFILRDALLNDNTAAAIIPEAINIASIVYVFLFYVGVMLLYSKIRKAYLQIYVMEITKIRNEELREQLRKSGFDANSSFLNIPGVEDFLASQQQQQSGFSNANNQNANKKASPSSTSTSSPNNATRGQTQEPEKAQVAHSKEYDDKIAQLYALSREQLNKIAQKLSIFGHEDYSKEELTKKIIGITDPDLT